MKIIDLHCDTIYKFFEDKNYSFNGNNGHISKNALINGDYMAQCFAIYTPPEIKEEKAFDFFKLQFENYFKIVDQSETFVLDSEIKAILTVENGELLNKNIERIKVLEEKGVKILGLIHNGENCLGYPHSMDNANAYKPLKQFGKEVIDYLNSTDIITDVSHLNLGGFSDVAEITKKPFIATHSACREILDHSRNLYDYQIKQIANSGGVIGIPFYSYFLNGTGKTEINDIIHHLEHLIKVGGEEVAALGSDFDGIECELPFKNAGDMQLLTQAIIGKFGINIAEKICYKNALRILG